MEAEETEQTHSENQESQEEDPDTKKGEEHKQRSSPGHQFKNKNNITKMKTFNELREYITEREKSPQYDKLAREISALRKKLAAKVKENSRIESKLDKEDRKGNTKILGKHYKETDVIGDQIEALQDKLYV